MAVSRHYAPRVSVVIPTYNRIAVLPAAVESVLAQEFRDFEIIVVDDGSTDDTGKYMHRYGREVQDIPLRYILINHRGVAAARNMGIHCSRGHWVAFLDSDDTWTPNKLQKQIDFLNAHPHMRFVHSCERWIRNGCRVNPPKAYKKYGGQVFLRSLPVCMIGASTVMAERILLEEIGGFNENFPVCEDYDLWLRITHQHQVGLVEEELTWKYGGHKDQLSTHYVGIDYWRLRALCGILANQLLSPERVNAVHHIIRKKAAILLGGYKKHGHFSKIDSVTAMICASYPAFKIMEECG